MFGKIGICRMMSNTLKNNELITGISILAVLKYASQMDAAKCMLIEPFLSYGKILQLMCRSNSSIKSVEDIMIKESIIFSNFDERYREKFMLSVNSIVLFRKLGLLNIENNMIIFNGYDFDFNEPTLGKKATKRIQASEKLAQILSKGEASDLYLSLRIKV